MLEEQAAPAEPATTKALVPLLLEVVTRGWFFWGTVQGLVTHVLELSSGHFKVANLATVRATPF